jgi:hypothetical protein
MSPQQLQGERGTHLDDIYSLGRHGFLNRNRRLIRAADTKF